MKPLTASVLLAALAATALADGGIAAPLLVREPVGVARTAAPVTGGVPVGPFGVKTVEQLAVLDADGRPVAAQITPTVTAPDGTLAWVLVDLKTDVRPNEVKRFSLCRTGERTPAPADRVQVVEAADALTVTTGPLKAVLSKKRFDLFEQVWLDRNGDGTFAADEQMLQTGQRPAGLVLVDAVSGKTFTSRDGVVHQVSFEDPGPLRITIRVDGACGDGTGATYLKYTARLTFRAGSPTVKLLYAVRNTNRKRNTAAKIRRATVTLSLAEGAGRTQYMVGAGKPAFSLLAKPTAKAERSSQRHHAVTLLQRGPNRAILSRTDRNTFHMTTPFDEMGYRVLHSQPSGRTRFAECGMHCGGWLDLSRDAGGCLLWLRNFTQNPLKRLRADAFGRMDLDVIPEYDGEGQMFYRGGGFWVTDAAYRTYEIAFHFHGRPLTTDADWAKWGRQFVIYAQATEETAAACNDRVATINHPLTLVCDPRWYSDTYALCGPIPSAADEARVNRQWGRVKEGPLRPQRQEVLGTDFLPRENYHWRSESDEPRDCLIQYLRTGEYDFWKRAHSFARVARDMGVFRCDGEPLGRRPVAEIWANDSEKRMTGTGWGSTKMCGCHNYGAGLIDLWLVTGDRSYRDAAIDNANAVGYRSPGPGSRFSRQFSRLSAGLLRVGEVTHEKRYREALARNVIFTPPDAGLRAQGLGVMGGESVGSWMHVIAAYAIYRNLTINADRIDPVARDDSRDRLIAWARVGAVSAKPGVKPKTKTGYGLCSILTLSYGYELTGDRQILEGARRIWERMHKLEADTVDARLRDWGASSGANLFWARHLFEAYAHPRADARPPAAVTDLTAEPLGGGKVKLTWTAPADAGNGRVDEYQLKHAGLPIVTWDAFYEAYPGGVGKTCSWFGAYNVAGEPTPAVAGRKQSMTVTGVPAGARCFRLRSWDDSSNQSDLSNEVTVEVR